MRIDDPQVLKVCELLEEAAATLRRLAGFEALNAPTSRRESRGAITEEQARLYVQGFVHEYPDLGVLQDELTDRGLTEAQAVNVIEAERMAREDVPA